jgi:hypothetical protein
MIVVFEQAAVRGGAEIAPPLQAARRTRGDASTATPAGPRTACDRWQK